MTTIRVSGPEGIVAAVPHSLGFTPAESIVTMGFGSGAFTARVDLPQNDDEAFEITEALAQAYRTNRVERVVLLAYTSDLMLAATPCCRSAAPLPDSPT